MRLVSHRVWVKGEEVHLTKTDYKLLHLLTHAMIIRQVWGADRPEHFVRVFTNTLRKKIGEGYIQTIIGVGYRFIDIPYLSCQFLYFFDLFRLDSAVLFDPCPA